MELSLFLTSYNVLVKVKLFYTILYILHVPNTETVIIFYYYVYQGSDSEYSDIDNNI